MPSAMAGKHMRSEQQPQYARQNNQITNGHSRTNGDLKYHNGVHSHSAMNHSNQYSQNQQNSGFNHNYRIELPAHHHINSGRSKLYCNLYCIIYTLY